MTGMEFEWDDAKDARNRAQKGIGLSDAARLDWHVAVREVDDRRDYGEIRVRAHVTMDRRLYVCVYAMRGAVLRVISLRKANSREERRYEQTDTT
jgi:uncharacterized protein